MSVPAYKRQKPDPNNPRDPEFVLLSKKLYVEVIDLLSCMSARYGRLISAPRTDGTMQNAHELSQPIWMVTHADQSSSRRTGSAEGNASDSSRISMSGPLAR